MNEIKLKDELISEIEKESRTFRSSVHDNQSAFDKLRTELKQNRSEVENYQQTTSRGTNERNELTHEVNTLRTKVGSLDKALHSYKAYLTEF